MAALEGGHRTHHGLDPVELILVQGVELLSHLTHARHHLEHCLERAHLLDGRHLVQEVIEGEVLVLQELAGHLRGLIAVEGLLRLLDQGQHVTHVEDP